MKRRRVKVHTTKELYRVDPDHFDHMTYWEALHEKIALSEIVMKAIHDEATDMTYGSKEYDKLYEIYQTTNKGKAFNEALINERKKYGNHSSKKRGRTLSS